MATERFHPKFAEDLRSACEYYDSISADLGLRFRNQVHARLVDIKARPRSFPRIGGDFRGAMVSGFPHVIVFTADQARHTFFGVRHAASDQGGWFSRSMPK
jgi:hypothetical protein